MEQYEKWEGYIEIIMRSITHLCFCFFFVNSYNPNGYLLAWNNPKMSQQRNGFAIAASQQLRVGPVTSYKWNYRVPYNYRGDITPGKPIDFRPFIGYTYL